MPSNTPVLEDSKVNFSSDNKALDSVRRGVVSDGSQANIPCGSIVFCKELPQKQAEEEVCFSLLSRLDMGEHAAKNVLYRKELEDISGVASIGLLKFVEYRELFLAKNTLLKTQIFDLDDKGRPQGFKVVKGLASVLMNAWVYGDDDLHRRNFGIFKDSQGVLSWGRIDFGRSLTYITDHSRPLRASSDKDTEISLARLKAFPVLSPHAPFYWPTSITLDNHGINLMGQHKGNAYSESDRQLFLSLQSNDTRNEELTRIQRIFLKERNEYLFRLFLIPNSLRRNLIVNMISNKNYAERLSFNVLCRISKLRWTALCDESFRQYVTRLSIESKNVSVESSELFQILTSVALEVGDIKNISITQDMLLKRAQRFYSQIELMQAEEESASCLELNQEIEAIMQSEISLARGGDAKPNEQATELRLSELLLKYFKRDSYQEGASKLELIQSFRASLMPLINLSRSFCRDELRVFFTRLIDEGVYSYFKEKLKDTTAETIYFDHISVRLRNIELVVSWLKKHKISEAQIKDALNIESFTALQKIDKKLAVIEKVLLEIYCEQLIKPLKVQIERQSVQSSDILSILGQFQNIYLTITMQVKQSLCEGQTQRARHLQYLYYSDAFNALKLMNMVLTEFVPKLPHCHDGSLTHIINKTHLRLEKISQKLLYEQSALKQQQALQEINLLLVRYCLEALMIKREQELESACLKYNQDGTDILPSHIPGRGFNEKKEQIELLINAAHGLSLALARPEYHDTLSLYDVSVAGCYGIKLLIKPNLDDAKRALKFSHYLTKSHQIRAKTKVAVGLSVMGAVVLFLGISFLCPPLAFTLASVVIGSTLASCGAVTAVSGAGFALYRFFRDKDKVKRKLDGVANQALLGIS